MRNLPPPVKKFARPLPFGLRFSRKSAILGSVEMTRGEWEDLVGKWIQGQATENPGPAPDPVNRSDVPGGWLSDLRT